MERELHAAQAEAQAANGRVDEIRQSSERQAAKLESEIQQAHARQADAERRAIDAEKRAVAAEAHLASERSAKSELDINVAALQQTVKRLEPDASRAAAAEAGAQGMREQITLLSETVTMLRSLLEGSGKVAPSSGPEGTKPKGK